MTETIQPFDPSVNLSQSLLWQYNDAVNLQALIEDKQSWYNLNQSQFWTDWYRDVFDLRTANLFGLSVWSIILGQPIVFNNVQDPDRPTWGFEQYHLNFTNGNFVNSNSTYVLRPETARILLQLRYFQLTSSGTVPETNRMLKYVFKNLGQAYLIDNNDMTQTYFFLFVLPSDLVFIFNNYDVLPRPAGVLSSYEVVTENPWGFETRENFDNGNLFNG